MKAKLGTCVESGGSERLKAVFVCLKSGGSVWWRSWCCAWRRHLEPELVAEIVKRLEAELPGG